jgi:hypothetical protein
MENGDIMTLPLTGEAKPQAYLQTKYEKRNAAFSPDGRWVAYNSDVSGRGEIYVQGFPERRGKWLVSAEGGRTPAWRADGKELYWVGPDRTLMAASVELQAAGVRPGRTEALFRLPTVDHCLLPAWARRTAVSGARAGRCAQDRRWWWLRIGRRGWAGSAVIGLP